MVLYLRPKNLREKLVRAAVPGPPQPCSLPRSLRHNSHLASLPPQLICRPDYDQTSQLLENLNILLIIRLEVLNTYKKTLIKLTCLLLLMACVMLFQTVCPTESAEKNVD